jgi:hypothetical protein
LFTAFYSYFNVLYNQLSSSGRKLRRTGDIPAFTASMIWLWWAPAVLSEMIVGRGPDDDEEWAAWALKKELVYPLQSVVLLRDIVQAASSNFDYEVTPAAEAMSGIAQLGKTIAGGPDVSRFELRSAVNTAGYWAGLPTKQMFITGEAMYRWMTGDDVPIEDFLLSPQRKAK